MKRLIVGLGNPGPKYAKTRHNIGWIVIDQLAHELGLSFKPNSRHEAELAAGPRVILAKPLTFMNNSGRAVARVARYFAVQPENITIIYDDLDLPLGTIRRRKTGSSGGHNGMKSIIDHLGTQDIARVRIGIGRNASDASDYVLKPFTKIQLGQLKPVIETVVTDFTKEL